MLNGENYSQCKKVAETIATSSLVKTAIYGKDANWGRIVCAAGYSGVELEPTAVQLWIKTPSAGTSRDGSLANVLHLFQNGTPLELDEVKASHILDQEDISIEMDLGFTNSTTNGTDPISATVWTCDLSEQYVVINGSYRS